MSTIIIIVLLILNTVFLIFGPRITRYVAVRWRNLQAEYSFWSIKYSLATVLFAILFGTLVSSLDSGRFLSSPQMANAVKAPIYGLVTAGVLFTLMIRGRTTRRSTYVDGLLRLIGVMAAALTGWSWLSSVTGNDPWPSLIAIAPFVGVLAIPGVIYHLSITYLGRPEYSDDEN